MKGYTLSVAKQVLNGKMDSIIKTVAHNMRLRALLNTNHIVRLVDSDHVNKIHFQSHGGFWLAGTAQPDTLSPNQTNTN
jgi:hypothetical protein